MRIQDFKKCLIHVQVVPRVLVRGGFCESYLAPEKLKLTWGACFVSGDSKGYTKTVSTD